MRRIAYCAVLVGCLAVAGCTGLFGRTYGGDTPWRTTNNVPWYGPDATTNGVVK